MILRRIATPGETCPRSPAGQIIADCQLSLGYYCANGAGLEINYDCYYSFVELYDFGSLATNSAHLEC